MPSRFGPVRLVLVVVAIAAFLAAPGSASASHVQCGDVITQDTTLDGDLFCHGNGVGIFGGEVTLDLNGHVIAGDGTGSGVYPSYGEINAGLGPFVVTIAGGTVRGFSTAIDMDGPDVVQVEDMVIRRSDVGVYCHYIPQCTVEDSVLGNNGYHGIVVDAADSSGQVATIRRNRVHHSGHTGIVVTDYKALIADNRITQNGERGIAADYGADLDMSDNVIAQNVGDGVYVTYMSSANITNNHILRNGGSGVVVEYRVEADVHANRISRNAGDGIHATGREIYASIDHNHTDRNGDDGIEIDPCPDDCDFYRVEVSTNKAFFNGDLGMVAGLGTTDGGGNRAKHNGNPAQCVGVRCK
jgi:hypothetical protein